jgi:hypothetical protein
MTMTPTTLKAKLPEFASVADDTVQQWLDVASQRLNADRWGTKYDNGHMLLTAHIMVRMGVLSNNQASKQPTGAMSSYSIGPVSKSFAVSTTTDDDDLHLTAYGLQYKALRKTLRRGPLVM